VAPRKILQQGDGGERHADDHQALRRDHRAADGEVGLRPHAGKRLRLGGVELLDPLLHQDGEAERGDDERQHAVAQDRVDHQALEQQPSTSTATARPTSSAAGNGKPPNFIAASTKNAGSITNSPCAKLMVCEVCHSSTKPTATSA
jgi:hypothetical protein